MYIQFFADIRNGYKPSSALCDVEKQFAMYTRNTILVKSYNRFWYRYKFQTGYCQQNKIPQEQFSVIFKYICPEVNVNVTAFWIYYMNNILTWYQ